MYKQHSIKLAIEIIFLV